MRASSVLSESSSAGRGIKTNGAEVPRVLEFREKTGQEVFERFKQNITKKAIRVLTEVLPQKIVLLSEVDDSGAKSIAATDFPDVPIYKIPNVAVDETTDCLVVAVTKMDALSSHKTPNGKKIPQVNVDGKVSLKIPEYVFLSGHLANEELNQRLENLKKEAYETIENVMCLKRWLNLNIPRIEDGNNFGVAIQEEALNELNAFEEMACNTRDAATNFFQARAKLVTKIIKYPNVQDYRSCLRNYDEFQWQNCKLLCMGMRDNYARIFDMLQKNWLKVVQPKSGGGSSMVS